MLTIPLFEDVTWIQAELNWLYHIRNWLDPEGYADFIRLLTHSGDHGFIWLCIALVLVLLRTTRQTGRACFVAIGLNYVIVNLLAKPLFARARPCEISDVIQSLITCPMDHSFPSGHTATAFAAAVAITCFQPRLGTPLLFLATSIAFSRLYLFVHFPSDVLIGMIIGSLCALMAVKIVRRNV